MGGVAVGANTPAEARAAWAEVLSLLDRTGEKPLIDSVFRFEELPKAFDRLAAGPMGKVLVQVKA
jgi:NADPH:quinone reductase